MIERLRLSCDATCAHCKKAVQGWVSLNQTLQVFDSGGFIIAGQRKFYIVCDACCRERGLPGSDEVVLGPDDPRIPEVVDSLLRAMKDR
jgi:hypothetical protein